MGNPVVHFEVLGKDGEALQSFYSDLFDWKINADNPMNYGIVDTGGEGPGIAAHRHVPALRRREHGRRLDATRLRAVRFSLHIVDG